MSKLIRLALIFVIILALLPLYARYKDTAGPIPPGVYLGGLNLSGVADPAEVREHLDAIYQQPIAVHFGDTRLHLRPEEVELRIEAEQMVREAEQYLEGAEFLDIAMRQALGYEQRRRDVPLRFVLNTEKLRAWLEEAAQTHNSQPTGPRLLAPVNRWGEGIGDTNNHQNANNPAANQMSGNHSAPVERARLPAGYVGVYSRDWTWTAGRPGYSLDIEASLPAVVAALTRSEDRAAHLILETTPPRPPAMADLEAAIADYLESNFPGFGSLYVEDLLRDERAEVHADVAYSGMSTVKIGIALDVMRRLEQGVHPDDGWSVQLGQLIDHMLGDSNNFAANYLLAQLGNEDRNLGARRYTEFLRTMGYENTYMQTGYDERAAAAQIATPANQNSVWNTNPDPNLQTTPREMGRLLGDLYYCAEGEGAILAHFPDELSPEKCRTVLFYMTHDEFQQMIWAGLPRPDNTWILHKHGFAAESYSDVALIWNSSGPYVISVFLWREGWLDWFTGNRAMKTISRITWNFFEFRAQELGLEEVPYFTLAPPPGYEPIPANHIPVVARGD